MYTYISTAAAACACVRVKGRFFAVPSGDDPTHRTHLRHEDIYQSRLQHTLCITTHCNILQHTHCNTESS